MTELPKGDTWEGESGRLSAFTSFQQTDTQRGHLDDIAVLADVARVYGGALSGKAAGVQLHDLLAGLQDLREREREIGLAEGQHS